HVTVRSRDSRCPSLGLSALTGRVSHGIAFAGERPGSDILGDCVRMVGSIKASGHGAGSATPWQGARAEPAQAYILETIRDPAALCRLEAEWRVLMAAASPRASIYQSFDWAMACAA